jgi:hypothetical protein
MATQFFYLTVQILFRPCLLTLYLWYLDRGWYVAILSPRTRGYQSFITVLVAWGLSASCYPSIALYRLSLPIFSYFFGRVYSTYLWYLDRGWYVAVLSLRTRGIRQMLQFLLVARGLSTSFYLLHRILSSLSSYIFLNRHTLRAVISYSLSLLQSSDVLVILCFLTANIRVTLALRRVTHPLIIIMVYIFN